MERLYLFGSSVSERFDLAKSDFDFLVTLQDAPPGKYADNYLGLANALEALLQRPVDLVTERSIRNPFFKEEVLFGRRLLYESGHEKPLLDDL